MPAQLNASQQQALAQLKAFTAKRNKISLVLSLIILLAYYIFILGIGLFPEVLGSKIHDSYITIGIFYGISLICLCIFSTGIYTWLANKKFDQQQQQLIEKIQSCDLHLHYQQHNK